MLAAVNRSLAIAVAAAAMTAGTVVAAGAGGATVTQGQVVGFGHPEIAGHAQLVRRANATTFAALHVQGLRAGGKYGAHVHDAPCDVSSGGAHFKQDPSGPGTQPNEIWPGDGLFVANAGGNADVNATVPYTANANAVSVVIHDLDGGGSRVACATLG